MHQQTVKNWLLKNGFRYVCGWVPEQTATRLQREIDKHKAAEAALREELEK